MPALCDYRHTLVDAVVEQLLDLQRRDAVRQAGAQVDRIELETPIRERPQMVLEEIDGDEVVVRISATPERPSDGPRLASEVLEAVAAQTARVAEPSPA